MDAPLSSSNRSALASWLLASESTRPQLDFRKSDYDRLVEMASIVVLTTAFHESNSQVLIEEFDRRPTLEKGG